MRRVSVTVTTNDCCDGALWLLMRRCVNQAPFARWPIAIAHTRREVFAVLITNVFSLMATLERACPLGGLEV